MPAFGSLGGLFMTSGSAGPPAKARLGNPSVIRLSQSMWIGKSGMGKPKRGAKKISIISPELVDRI